MPVLGLLMIHGLPFPQQLRFRLVKGNTEKIIQQPLVRGRGFHPGGQAGHPDRGGFGKVILVLHGDPPVQNLRQRQGKPQQGFREPQHGLPQGLEGPLQGRGHHLAEAQGVHIAHVIDAVPPRPAGDLPDF